MDTTNSETPMTDELERQVAREIRGASMFRSNASVVGDAASKILKHARTLEKRLRLHSASRERMEKALRNLLRHPIGVSTNAMDIAEARAALSAASQEGKK